MFPYPVINCQGLSNLLGLLAVGLNEPETALMYNNKNVYSKTTSVTNLSSFSNNFLKSKVNDTFLMT